LLEAEQPESEWAAVEELEDLEQITLLLVVE
jgi:hypothetical protein